MLRWLKAAHQERSKKSQKETGRRSNNESGNEENARMMHDSQQITQSAAAEENDSLIFGTSSAMPNFSPPALKTQGKVTLPISCMLLLKTPTKIISKNGRRYIAASLVFICKLACYSSTC